MTVRQKEAGDAYLVFVFIIVGVFVIWQTVTFIQSNLQRIQCVCVRVCVCVCVDMCVWVCA